MPNIRIKQALEKLDTEINRIGEHAAHHSGIASSEASAVHRLCDDIITTAKQIKELADNPV
jgi:hypothetical protein